MIPRRAAGRARPRTDGARFFVAAAIGMSLFVNGCASLAPLSPEYGTNALSGRLAIRVDAAAGEPVRAMSAAFDLRGDASSGAIALSTPLGSMLAQARWTAGTVTLTTPQGVRSFATLDELTHEVLGESVPVAAWFDWLRGRPWPAVPSAATASGFEQLGWSVDLARLADGAIKATRGSPSPVVTVQIKVDR